MMIFERDIAIDLGTTNIRVFVRGKGIMLREPSIVAVDKYTGRMLKVGQDAQKMLGRTPANIVAIHPISAGVISDYDMTALMLKELLSRVTSFSLSTRSRRSEKLLAWNRIDQYETEPVSSMERRRVRYCS